MPRVVNNAALLFEKMRYIFVAQSYTRAPSSLLSLRPPTATVIFLSGAVRHKAYVKFLSFIEKFRLHESLARGEVCLGQ